MLCGRIRVTVVCEDFVVRDEFCIGGSCAAYATCDPGVARSVGREKSGLAGDYARSCSNCGVGGVTCNVPLTRALVQEEIAGFLLAGFAVQPGILSFLLLQKKERP